MNSTTASRAFIEPRRHRLILLVSDVAPHDRGDDHEEQRRHQPDHEDVLGHREVDAVDLRQMDQRMIDAAVGDVTNDRLAGIESFFGDFLCGLGRMLDFVALATSSSRNSTLSSAQLDTPFASSRFR